jgi:hypothetical protein
MEEKKDIRLLLSRNLKKQICIMRDPERSQTCSVKIYGECSPVYFPLRSVRVREEKWDWMADSWKQFHLKARVRAVGFSFEYFLLVRE